MKTIFKLGLAVFLVLLYSCRDTKTEDATINATEKIETIEVETDSIVKDLEIEAKDLEKELEELN